MKPWSTLNGLQSGRTNKTTSDIDGYLTDHKLVMRFMLSFNQLDAVLMLLKGKFMQIAVILLQHSRNRRFTSIICWFRALLEPTLRKSRLSITFFTDMEEVSIIPQNNLTENMKNWTDRFPRLSRLDQGLKGRIESNSNIIFLRIIH